MYFRHTVVLFVLCAGVGTPMVAQRDDTTSVGACFSIANAGVISISGGPGTAASDPARRTLQAQVKSCFAKMNVASVSDRHQLGQRAILEAMVGDTRSLASFQTYASTTEVPFKDRIRLLDVATRMIAATVLSDSAATAIPTLRALSDIADQLRSTSLQIRTRLSLASVYRATPERAQSFAVISSIIPIIQRDPDTTQLQRRVLVMAGMLNTIQEWGEQDKSPLADSVIERMTAAFAEVPGYVGVVDGLEALVGTKAPAVFASQWLNVPPKDTLLSFGNGHIYLIAFTAHWCGPCIATYEPLIDLAKRYGSQLHVVFVTRLFGVYNDEVLTPAAEIDSTTAYFTAGHKIPFPVAISGTINAPAGTDQVSEDYNSLTYGVQVLPTLVLIDGQGIVKKVMEGTEYVPTLESELQAVGMKPISP